MCSSPPPCRRVPGDRRLCMRTSLGSRGCPDARVRRRSTSPMCRRGSQCAPRHPSDGLGCGLRVRGSATPRKVESGLLPYVRSRLDDGSPGGGSHACDVEVLENHEGIGIDNVTGRLGVEILTPITDSAHDRLHLRPARFPSIRCPPGPGKLLFKPPVTLGLTGADEAAVGRTGHRWWRRARPPHGRLRHVRAAATLRAPSSRSLRGS